MHVPSASAHHRHRRPIRCRQGHSRARACAAPRTTGISIRARCIAPSRGKRFTTACRSRTKTLWRRWRSTRTGRQVLRAWCIDGHDVTTAIRTTEIDRAAAAVSRLPKVRAVLVARQRQRREGRRNRDGRPRYRLGRVSRCRREDLSRCCARRARTPACGRSRAR